MPEPLFPYQLTGASWLAQQSHALLADEMGLGKSAQAITACDLVQARRIVVLCPASARVNWAREFDRWSASPRDLHVVFSNDEKKRDASLVICSYGLVETVMDATALDVLILDESHYLKSHAAQRSKHVFGSQGLVHRTKRVWALSGTPAPNNASELWIMLYTFGHTKLKYEDFVTRYCTYYRQTYCFNTHLRVTGTNERLIPELRTILNPMMLRRKKDEVLKDLPPIFYTEMLVEAGKTSLDSDASFIKYYASKREDQLFKRIKEEETLLSTVFNKTVDKSVEGDHNSVIRAMEALAPSVSTLRRYCGLQKVAAIVDMVDAELMFSNYDKVIIFALHQSVIENLRVGLLKWNPVTLYGGTPPEKRQRNIDRFQNTDKYRVFIGQIQAAGTAITLTRANHIVIAEAAWDPSSNAQAICRAHRIGQTKPVFARFIGLANSIDDKVTQILRQKTRQLGMLLDPEVDNVLVARGLNPVDLKRFRKNKTLNQ